MVNKGERGRRDKLEVGINIYRTIYKTDHHQGPIV